MRLRTLIVTGLLVLASSAVWGANTYPELKTKIDECACSGDTDAEVLAWLNQTETGPWLNVQANVFAAWSAQFKLPGRLFAAGNIAPASDAQSASHMLYVSWRQREGLMLADEHIRGHLADAVGNPVATIVAPVSVAARDALLAVARPDVARWRNAPWTRQPGLGDVTRARALP